MRILKLCFTFILCCIILNDSIGQEGFNLNDQLKAASSKSDSIIILIDATQAFRFSAPEKGLETSRIAHNLSLELKDTALMILSSNKKALIQKENSLENLALGSIVNSLIWANKFDDDSLLAYTNLVAGHVYSKLGDSDKSLTNYDNALSYYLDVNDSSGICFTYSGMGGIYYQLGDSLLALDYLLLSENYWVDDKPYLKAGLWNNIGVLYFTLGELDRSKLYYEKAFSIYNTENMYAGISGIYYNLGELELIRGDYKLSSEYYNKSLNIGFKINSPTEVMYAYEGLYANKKQSGNFEKALIYFENYIRIRDSLSNAQNLIEVKELEVKYEQDQNLLKIKEQEVEIYQKEINVQSEKLKNFIFAAVILFILVLFGIGILFYFRIRKNNSLLEAQKLTISKSLFEKEILLKEIHHRVKNNMQLISSLLNLQKNSKNKESVEYVINETQNRIQAIALVHQKLYLSKDIEAVNFEGYLTELIDLQMDVFQNDKAPLELIIDVPKTVKIELDLAISLGLIVSEILTNAFKYAFDKVNNPKLIIRLYEINETEYELNIKDNGPGVPKGFLSDENESLGKELIQVLTGQINGEMKCEFEQGASFYIKFPH